MYVHLNGFACKDGLIVYPCIFDKSLWTGKRFVEITKYPQKCIYIINKIKHDLYSNYNLHILSSVFFLLIYLTKHYSI